MGTTLARRFPDQAGELLTSLSDFSLTEARLDVRWRTQALSLAGSYEVAFYDAAYHAVALIRGGVFVTADERYGARGRCRNATTVALVARLLTAGHRSQRPEPLCPSALRAWSSRIRPAIPS